jgi:SSS family solute:Na+ symporter
MIPTLRWYDYLSAVLFLIFMIVIGTWKSKDENEEDFLVGGRIVPGWKLAGTISAGVIGGAVLLIFSEYAFRYGLSALFIIGGIVVGTLFMIPVALKFKPLADRQLFYTLPDLYAHEWGKHTGLLATIIVAIWTTGFIVMSLISSGEVLREITGWPYSVGVLLSAGTVAIYLYVSGFRAVVVTDLVQYIALLVLLLLIQPTAINRIGVEGLNQVINITRTQHMSWPEAIGFFILGSINMVVSADLWLRVYAAKNERAARQGLYLSAFLILLSGLLLLTPPLFARLAIPNAAPNRALLESLSLLLPRWLLGFGLIAVLCTVVAALDTMVFILGISIGHDLRVKQLNKSVENRVRTTRLTMLLTLAGGVILSLLYRQLLPIGLAISSFGLILAPSIILRAKSSWKPTTLAVNLGMYLGLLTIFALIVGDLFVPNLLSPENAAVVLLPAILGTIIGSVVSKFRGK